MSTLVLEDLGASTPGQPLRLRFDSTGNTDVLFEVSDAGELHIIPDSSAFKLFENPALGTRSARFQLFPTGTPFIAGNLFISGNAVGNAVGNLQGNGKIGGGVSSNSAVAGQSDETSGASILNGINNAVSGTRSILRCNYGNVTPNDEVSRFIHCLDNTTLRMQVWSNGDVENINNNFGGLSDASLKQGIRDANSQWDDFKAMRFRKWKFNTEVDQYGDDAKECLGVVGQEMQDVSPGLVRTRTTREIIEENITDEGHIVTKVTMKNDGPPILSIAYSILYMKGMVALQEAMRRIEVLEAAV